MVSLTMNANALDQPPYVKSPKTRPQRAKPVTQAIVLQQILYDAANAKAIAPTALAQVARAWCELEDTKRDIQMKPRPKPIDVAQMHAAKRKPASRGFTETPADKPVMQPDKPAE